MKMSYSKKNMLWSLCAALCVVLPQTLRVIPNAGLVYKAMHIPVLLCGMLCGPGGGFLCGALGVFVSALISGAPSVPMLPVILLELSLMGFISGFVMKASGKSRSDAVIYCVFLAVLLSRTVAGAAAALVFSPGYAAMPLWIWAYVIAALPSFIIQLILLPAIIRALEYSGLVSDDKREEPVHNTDKEDPSAEKSI